MIGVGAPQTDAAVAAGVKAASLATLLRGEGTTYPTPGPIAADSTGNGHDGLITGATWVAGDSADSSDPGGEALAFSGTSDYVDIPTAVDLALSRTISVTLDVEFVTGPGTQAQVLLQKGPGDGSVSPYAVRVAPSTASGCNTSACAAIGLYWGSQWMQSKPVAWNTGQWYSIQIRDDGTNVVFSRGASPSTLGTLSSVPDPTGGAGTHGSSGSLFLGGGPAGAGADPLSGELQDVQLAVPLTVPPALSGETVSYTSAPLGTPLTITVQISGAWSNPDDPYLPQPDIYDELHKITPVAIDMADPGSITATAAITTPDGSAVQVPGFLNQNFVADSNGVAPAGPPVWTFRYTPRTAGTFSASVSATTFDGSAASTATVAAPLPFTVESTVAAHYQGFVQIDKSSGDQSRYYQYSQTRNSYFTAGSNLEINELTDASHVHAESALFGGSPGTVETINGQPVIVGAKPGNGETSLDLGYVYQQYHSDVSNLAAVGATGARMRLDSVFMPLELCSAGNWSYTCAQDLQEVYRAKSPSGEAGLVGYANGVMPSPAEVFASGLQNPEYFGTFAVGRYNEANAWIIDQTVEQARLAGIAMQVNAWNTNIDLGGSCYALADKSCRWYNHGRNNQSLVERRLYYDEARWGYSTSISAWELVNEYPASQLTPFWNGATISVNGVPTYIPGVVSWLRGYNDATNQNSNPHLVTSSCSATLPNPLCDLVDQVESHWYVTNGVQAAYDQLNWACVVGQPCLRSEYGLANCDPADPNSWVVHKGVWAALAANYSGAWYWCTEQALNNSSNTPPNPAIPTYSNNIATWDPIMNSQNGNPYIVFNGISTFDQSWPGSGPDDPDGLDSYVWQKLHISGANVTGPNPSTPGLAAEGMIGTSVADGALNAIVWLVNNDSTGADPSSPGNAYPVVPAGTVKVAPCSSCTGFTAGQSYKVQMWDTVTGTVIATLSTTVTASSSGAVTLQVPAIATDMAITITHT